MEPPGVVALGGVLPAVEEMEALPAGVFDPAETLPFLLVRVQKTLPRPVEGFL